MKWTDEKPVLPGWYWYKQGGAAVCVLVYADPDMPAVLRVVNAFSLIRRPTIIDANPGQWSERIEEPDEPSTIETGIRPIEVYPVGLGSREEPPTMVERKYVDPDLDSGD